jgi:hypothetical protein
MLDPYHYDDSNGNSDGMDDGMGVLGGRIGAQLEWDNEDPDCDRWSAHLVYPAAIDLYTDKAAQMTCVITRRPGAAGDASVFVLMTQGADVGKIGRAHV